MIPCGARDFIDSAYDERRLMNDPRIDRLAEILLDHSTQIQAGENILIEAFDLPEPTLVCRLVELAAARGARPFVSWKNNEILRSLYRSGTEDNLGAAGELRSEERR